MDDLRNLKSKVGKYQEVLENTLRYRVEWTTELKEMILGNLQKMLTETKLQAEIEIKDDITNLEAIVLSLGTSESGFYEDFGGGVRRHLIKQNGSLIYQQLFNGKVIVLIQYPMIEGYGEPRPPKTIAIYRPEELQAPFFVRHMEEFISDVIDWEDYDDDEPHKRIGFDMNFGQE